jgi:hypothetical protein
MLVMLLLMYVDSVACRCHGVQAALYLPLRGKGIGGRSLFSSYKENKFPLTVAGSASR